MHNAANPQATKSVEDTDLYQTRTKIAGLQLFLLRAKMPYLFSVIIPVGYMDH